MAPVIWKLTFCYYTESNQLEKLEDAKAAGLVCLTGSFLILLGPSGSIFTDITGPYWALGLYWAVLGCTGLYWAVLGCTGLYWAVLGLTGPY